MHGMLRWAPRGDPHARQWCPPLPALPSYGRVQEKNATCKTYIAANAGCSFSWPSLAGAPSSDTKWIFDAVPGGSIYRWYIRMSVSALTSITGACTCLIGWASMGGLRKLAPCQANYG